MDDQDQDRGDYSSPPPGQGLTRRAKLTFVTQLLARGSQLISGLVFTPIIVRGLGKDLYGSWGMIMSMVGFLGMADLNAVSILKLVLGVRQHSSDVAEKRRLIGAAVGQWIVFFPLLVAAGGSMVVFSERLVPAGSESAVPVRWALGLMALSIPLRQISAIPASVLAGQNLHYKAMGLNAVMVLLSGALGAIAVSAGYGLVGLAVASIAGIVLLNGSRYFVARRAVPWIGVGMPMRSELWRLVRLSVPGTLGALAGRLLGSADVLLVGYCFGTDRVSVYLITGAMVRYLVQPLQEVLRSGNSGISYLVGSGEWKRLSVLRSELHHTALWGSCVLLALVAVVNASFVRLWVGPDLYGGMTLGLAIALSAVLMQLARLDAIPLDATLHLYPKVALMLVWSVLGLASGLGLAQFGGPFTIPLGMATGQLGLLVSYQFLLRRYTKLQIREHLQSLVRPVLVAILLSVVSLGLRLYWKPSLGNWFVLAAAAAGTCLVVGILFAVLGVQSEVRVSVLRRLLPSSLHHLVR